MLKPHDSDWNDALIAYAVGTADEATLSAVCRHLDNGCKACERETLAYAAVGIATLQPLPR